MGNQVLVFNDQSYFEGDLPKIAHQKIKKLPFRLIGLITMKRTVLMGDNRQITQTGVGTGTLISPNLVLTVAHNIYNRQRKKDNTDLRFYLAQHGEIPPDDAQDSYYEIQDYRYDPRFREQNSPEYDIALLKLRKMTEEKRFIKLVENIKTVEKSDKIGIFGYIGKNVGNYYWKKENENGQEIHRKYNYPENKKYAYQQGDGSFGCDIITLEQGGRGEMPRIIHTLATEKGHSGAIIYLIRNNEYSIIGVHKGKLNNNNIGVMLTTDVITTLTNSAKELNALPFNVKVNPSKLTRSGITSSQTCINTAEHYMQGRQWKKAAFYYNTFLDVLESDTAHFWANYYLAYVLTREAEEEHIIQQKLGKLRSALAVIDRVIQLMQQNAKALILKGYILSHLAHLTRNRDHQYENALKCFQRAHDAEPNNFDTLLNIGSIRLSLNKLQQGIGQIQEVAIHSRTADVCNNMGFYYFKSNQLDRSQQLFREAIEIQSDHEQAYLNWGQVLQQKGQDLQAIEKFKEGLKNHPSNADFYKHIGECQLSRGNLQEYQKNFRMYRELTGEDPVFPNRGRRAGP